MRGSGTNADKRRDEIASGHPEAYADPVTPTIVSSYYHPQSDD
jgi:hypothetical protein